MVARVVMIPKKKAVIAKRELSPRLLAQQKKKNEDQETAVVLARKQMPNRPLAMVLNAAAAPLLPEKILLEASPWAVPTHQQQPR